MKLKLRWTLILPVLFLVSCGGPSACFPNFSELKTKYPHVIYRGPERDTKIEIKKDPPQDWAPLDTISRNAQWAILVSEDWAFYQHQGIDEKQIKDAVEKSLEQGKLKRGASTITQQVVRNIYLTKHKTMVRKAREIWMSTKIEKSLGKKKILELYLNIAEWGEGIFGIGRAARVYFNKTPAELTAKDGAFLAMLLPSPKKYAISFKKHALTPFAQKIIHSVLDKMVQAKILTPEERDIEWHRPYAFETGPPIDSKDVSEEEAEETNDELPED